ncbi:hypothetical protein HKD37_02G003995 [Glycine soja]
MLESMASKWRWCTTLPSVAYLSSWSWWWKKSCLASYRHKVQRSHVATSRLLQLVFLFSYSAMQYLLGCAALQDEKEEKTVSKDFVKAGSLKMSSCHVPPEDDTTLQTTRGSKLPDPESYEEDNYVSSALFSLNWLFIQILASISYSSS